MDGFLGGGEAEDHGRMRGLVRAQRVHRDQDGPRADPERTQGRSRTDPERTLDSPIANPGQIQDGFGVDSRSGSG